MLDITSRGEVVLDSQLCLFGWLLPSGRAMLPKCTWRHILSQQASLATDAGVPLLPDLKYRRLLSHGSVAEHLEEPGKEPYELNRGNFLYRCGENAPVACSCPTFWQKRKLSFYDNAKITTHTIMNASYFTFTPKLHTLSCSHLKHAQSKQSQQNDHSQSKWGHAGDSEKH